MKYPHIFEPLDLGFTTLKNRIYHGFNAYRLRRRRKTVLEKNSNLLRRDVLKVVLALSFLVESAPNIQGWTAPFAAQYEHSRKHARHHQSNYQMLYTHEGGKICMQILHCW